MSATINIKTGQVLSQVRKGVKRGTLLAANHLMTQAVERTPIGETGNLRGSATAKSTGKASADVRYSIVYAARQHEETGWNHPRGGQAKYLESAAQDSVDEIKGIVTQAIKGLM